jgi:hypothetical protein
MGGGVAGGRYKVVWRGGQWVVRAPDGRTMEGAPSGPSDVDRAKANLWKDRANQKLRVVDNK